MPGIWLSGDATFETTPKLKVDTNICVAFQCSFILCGCVLTAVTRKRERSALKLTRVWISVCGYYDFFLKLHDNTSL